MFVYGVCTSLHKYRWQGVNGVIVPLRCTCPQLPKCLQKYDKSGYVADTEEPVGEIAVEIEIPSIPPGEVITLPPRVDDPPPAKRFRQELRKRFNQSSVQSAIDDDDESYCTDDEYALESTDWKNDTSDSSDWEKLSEFSDTESSSGSD